MGRREREHVEAEAEVTSQTKESAFDVVDHVGPAAVFRGGPKPRPPADRHGAVDVEGERVSVFVQSGPSWPSSEVLARGRVIVTLKHRNLARAFFFDSSKNKFHYVVERVGGVALPALVRKVRRRSGTLPAVTCARIVRDLCRAQHFVDAATPRERFRTVNGVAAIVADSVVSWEGRVVIAPRLFGSPADAPAWLHRNTIVQAVGALLLALLMPEVGDDVDAAVMKLLVDHVQLKGSGSAALDELTMRALSEPTPPPRRRRGTPAGASHPLDLNTLAEALDQIVNELGGDNEEFAASLMAEIFGDRKRADLAWREEMTAVPL